MSALASHTHSVALRPVLQVKPRMSVGESGNVLSVQFPDAHAARCAFAARWTRFLHDNWRNHVQVAAVFSVSEKTARQWWEGVTAPQGWAVDYVSTVLRMEIPAGDK